MGRRSRRRWPQGGRVVEEEEAGKKKVRGKVREDK